MMKLASQMPPFRSIDDEKPNKSGVSRGLFRLVLLSLVAIQFGSPQLVVARGLQDRAKLLNPGSERLIEKRMREIYGATGARILVETQRGIPRKEGGSFGGDVSDGQLQEALTDWSNSRSKAMSSEEVVLVVGVKPEYLLVLMGDRYKQSGVFTSADRDLMMRVMTEKFSNRDFSAGILAGMDNLATRLSVGEASVPANAQISGSSPRAVPGREFVFWLLGAFGVLAIAYAIHYHWVKSGNHPPGIIESEA